MEWTVFVQRLVSRSLANSSSRYLLEIHLAVLLFGLAGLFGKLIALPAAIIVLGRVFFASISLYLMMKAAGRRLALANRRDYGLLALLGALLALHWVAFFQSIQVSTVAVGLLTFSTFPVFAVFLEPFFFREERTAPRDVLLAGLTFLGVALVIPEFELENSYVRGVLWGILSGFTFALLSILNRRYVRSYSSLTLAFYQDLIATLLLLPFLWVWKPVFTVWDIGLLVLLGVVFTALSHSLFINGLRGVPARAASVIASLEPVYGILAAFFLLGEQPEWRVVIGGGVILSVAAYATLAGSR